MIEQGPSVVLTIEQAEDAWSRLRSWIEAHASPIHSESENRIATKPPPTNNGADALSLLTGTPIVVNANLKPTIVAYRIFRDDGSVMLTCNGPPFLGHVAIHFAKGGKDLRWITRLLPKYEAFCNSRNKGEAFFQKKNISIEKGYRKKNSTFFRARTMSSLFKKARRWAVKNHAESVWGHHFDITAEGYKMAFNVY